MKALYIERHGAIADLKATEVAKPNVSPNGVLVKIEAAGVNPSDIASVQGAFPNAVLPRIVGRDFAGIVEEGPPDLIGAKVWGSGGDLGITRNGTHAEYIALPAAAVSRRPNNLTAEEAAAAGVPFVAAFSALHRVGEVKEGEWVIVSGAAGAVGQAATQLAHAAGASVIALIKNSTEEWVSKSDGIRAVARSDQTNLEHITRDITGGKGADLALNGVGASIFKSVLGALATGGRQVIYSTAGGREFNLDLFAFYRQELTLFGLNTGSLDASECAAILTEIIPLFESGKLKAPAVGHRYPLTAAAKAYGLAASGKGGKVVLTMI